MSALAFLRGPEATALMARAAQAAGMPLSLHYVERNQEGPRILGWGGCAACRQVAALPGGRLACRLSRQTASTVALRQRRPLSFVCHMGFGCFSVPVLPDEGFVLTFGPYVPAGEDQGLLGDVRTALDALDAGGAEDPELSDIHRAPQGTVPAVAAWLLEGLHAAWARHLETQLSEETAPAPAPEQSLPRRARPPGVKVSPYAATEIAAALAGGDLAGARALLSTVLEETEAAPRRLLATQRARMAAAVAATLEAGARAGLPTGEAWTRFDALPQALSEAGDASALLDAAMAALGVVGRRAAPRKAPATSYQALNQILAERLLDGPTLAEAAALMGEAPATVSKRLQRNFGMGYSEYLGRLRIDKAKEYLRKGRLSATEVARRVGISDQSNFGKLFKKYEGMTPLEYRQRHGKKAR